MVTDLAEIYRLGTAKAQENLDFRRHLRARHQAEEPFQVLATQVQTHIDCTACANCCRHSSVTVNQGDIRRIADQLGTTPAEVTRLYTDPEPGAPALRSLKTSPRGCVFLDGNLCLIYDARPKGCRDFPHVGVGTHSLGGRPSSHARWAAYCPIIYNALEDYKHLTGYHPHRSAGAKP